MANKPESKTLHTVELGQYDEGLMMTDYGGRIGIYSCKEGRDGKKWMRFCHPSTKDGPSDQKYPQGLTLGERKQAIGILEQFLHVLKNG
jgi:hypothetical protein